MPADIQTLNEIALAAKAHWGYSAEQLRAWKADLTVSAEALAAKPVWVAEENGRPTGFVQVAMDTQPWELEALWVDPGHMGRGVGKALLAWARQQALAGGQSELAIDADPHAEAFYRACGARLVGTVPAPIAGSPERVRPQLRLQVKAEDGDGSPGFPPPRE
ncbi:GNAT family N-acetyltransferase [Caenimonas sedimenti]|nr:GNAT family N-acetyltransferase [Caenimonas sedimenti]